MSGSIRIFFFTLTAFFATSLSSQTVSTPASTVTPPVYSTGPVTDYSAALPNSTDVLRFRRGERYNSPNSPLPELGEASDPTLVVEDMGNFSRDPMPFSLSDAVVAGTIANGQAYLSNDKRDIYSEFKVIVHDVTKTSNAIYLRPGETIIMERHGGAIKLPSGKVLIRASKNYSMPLVGKRYLLFLKYNDSTEDYHLLTAYQLEGSHVYSLDDLDYAQKDRHPDVLVHPLHEQGDTEEKFLGRVKAAKPPTAKGGD